MNAWRDPLPVGESSELLAISAGQQHKGMRSLKTFFGGATLQLHASVLPCSAGDGSLHKYLGEGPCIRIALGSAVAHL